MEFPKKMINAAPSFNNQKGQFYIRIANASGTNLEDGQKVLVCKVGSKEIISQRTGKRMGVRERVITPGIIEKNKHGAFIRTAKQVHITEPLVVIGSSRHCFPLSKRKRAETPTIYAKIVEE